MSTGMVMMLKSLGLDPKMIENVARAVQSAATDLHTIKEQQAVIILQQNEILQRLNLLERKESVALIPAEV